MHLSLLHENNKVPRASDPVVPRNPRALGDRKSDKLVNIQDSRVLNEWNVCESHDQLVFSGVTCKLLYLYT